MAARERHRYTRVKADRAGVAVVLRAPAGTTRTSIVRPDVATARIAVVRSVTQVATVVGGGRDSADGVRRGGWTVERRGPSIWRTSVSS